MENEPKFGTAKAIVIGVIAILVIAAGIGFWYWSKSEQSSQGAPSLGSEIFGKTQNQLEGQVPDANPFKDQRNPFDTIYQNPFE